MGWLGKQFRSSKLQRSLVGCFLCSAFHQKENGVQEFESKARKDSISFDGSFSKESLTVKEVQVYMDEVPWSSLDPDILDKVLACLPIPALFRMRLVCKRWKDLIYSRYFLQICSETPSCREPCLPAFFRSDGEEIWWSAFDHSSQRWQRMPSPLPALGTHKDNFYVRGAGGLLCVAKWGEQEIDTLIVCNPVIGHWCSITTPSLKWRPSLIQFVVDNITKGYHIILAGDLDARGNNLRYRRTEVYDSSSCVWTQVGDLPPNLYMALNYGVVLKGFMYCVALSGHTGQELAGILRFDIQQGVWQDPPYLLPEPDGSNLSSHEACVVECRGEIMAVLEEICREDGQFRGIAITVHTLDLVSKKWTKVAEMPQPLTYNLYNKRCSEGIDISMGCVGHGDLLCIINEQSCSVVLYNVHKRTWVSLPQIDENRRWRGQQSQVHSMGFPFELSLLAPVKQRRVGLRDTL